MQFTGELRNWQYDPRNNVYWGRLHNDIKKRWKEGVMVHTSNVVSVNELDGDYIVTTLNSVYLLKRDQEAGHESNETAARCKVRVQGSGMD